MDSPSDTSSTATADPSSPDASQMENTVPSSWAKPSHTEGSKSPLLQNAVLGQLSYAPATQTTVVTTTTTTTTSFPPLILQAPRHLHERDPKLYPLAASPTPNEIKRFTLKIANRLALYQEADNLENSLVEVLFTNLGLEDLLCHQAKTANT